MPRDNGENLYVKAIHHPDRTEQLRAFMQFTEQEMDRVWRQLQDLEHDDGSIPDENRERWSQRKGELDTHRLLYGMFTQALLTQQGGFGALHGEDTALGRHAADRSEQLKQAVRTAFAENDNVTCHACGENIDHIEEPEDVGHPVCPQCGGNPLPPVGGDRLPTDDAPADAGDDDAA